MFNYFLVPPPKTDKQKQQRAFAFQRQQAAEVQLENGLLSVSLVPEENPLVYLESAI